MTPEGNFGSRGWRTGLVVVLIAAVASVGWWGWTDVRERRAMSLVIRSLRACRRVSHVARQTTTVYTGAKPVATAVEIAYRARVRPWVPGARHPDGEAGTPPLTRMVFLSPPLRGMTVMDDGERTLRLDPDRSRVVICSTPRVPGRTRARQRLLERNYRARVTGEETIAGRPAYRIELRPRHAGNPWKRLWVDRKAFILLASEDYDGWGRRTRSSRVESVQFRGEPASALRPSAALVKSAQPEPGAETEVQPWDAISQAVSFPVLPPRHLPPGYVLEGAFVYACQCGCQLPAARLQYADGLNSISVLQCGHRCHHRGAWGPRGLPQGTAVRVLAGQNTIVVVGESARTELERMAQSIPGAHGANQTAEGKPEGP